jgi:diguanylate cyclase (GGDEF)-like protein
MDNNETDITAEQLLQLALNNIPMRVFWKDINSYYIGCNQLFLDDRKSISIDQLMGKSDYDFTHNIIEAQNFIKDDQDVMLSGIPKLGIEEPLSMGDGNTLWLRTNKVPLTDNQNNVIGLLGTYEDITERVQYREKIEQQALMDSLTSLANRRGLQNRITDFKGNYAGLLFIDLDYFKVVNDSLGHFVGDMLLQSVAERLTSIILIEKGLVARLAGDEFCVFTPLFSEEEFEPVMANLADLIIESVLEPFIVDQHVLNIGASIGITMIRQDSINYSRSFQEADMAMYAAKEKGRRNYQFYDDSMGQKMVRTHATQRCLHQALEKNEFHLVYQPQYDNNAKLIGVEALLRWENAELGFVPPDEFIKIAEQMGLIHSLGLWVFNTALDALVSWNKVIKLDDKFKLAINVSSKQFRSPTVVSDFKMAIESRHLSASNVQIEITESLLIEDRDNAVRSMLQLQRLGMSIAIDDFGTGYSSLSYLANLPIDKLKIDRSFVEKLDSNTVNRKLVDTLINMSKNLHMEVIAEGVETLNERNVLLELGCQQFQGYLFSRPLKSEDFISQILTKKLSIMTNAPSTKKLMQTKENQAELNQDFGSPRWALSCPLVNNG